MGVLTDEETKSLILQIASTAGWPSDARISLPDRKDASPKLVCLDTKDWIELANAENGKSSSRAFAAALARLREGTAGGRIVLPISSMNVLEVGAISDLSWRGRLAAFMVDLSKNHSLVDHVTVRKRELRDAIARAYLQRPVTSLPRSALLRWGIASAGGFHGYQVPDATAAQQRIVEEVHNHPFTSTRGLASVGTAEAAALGREMDESWRATADLTRSEMAHLPPKRRRELESLRALQGGHAAWLREAALQLDTPWAPLEEWLKDAANSEALIEHVPSLSVTLGLRLARDRDAKHLADKNDLKDLLYLGLAIPYANVVVTDKAWAHIASTTDLAKKFGTTICRHVSEVAKTLDAWCSF